MTTPRPATARQVVESLIDSNYARYVAPLLSSISGEFRPGTELYRRWQRVEAEATRLADQGERMNPDSRIVRLFLAEIERAMKRQMQAIAARAAGVQAIGIRAGAYTARALTLPGVTDAAILRAWNIPDPDALTRIIDYVSSAAWKAEIGAYPQFIVGTVQRSIVSDFYAGIGPLASARHVRSLLTTMPTARANSMLRTLELSAMRDATATSYIVNERMLAYQIRIATFDGRVCAACLALHGMRLEIGERVDDHHSGRCTSVGVIKGMTRNIETGPDWFARQPAAYQRSILGAGGYRDYASGRLALDDFIQPYTDKVYGQMVRQASLQYARSGDARTFVPSKVGSSV